MVKLDQAFWARYFQTYDVLDQVIPYQKMLDDVITVANVKKGQVILDVGSGTGNLSVRLRQLGAVVTALDSSKEGHKILASKDSEIIRVTHDLIEPLPFLNNTFDAVISINTLYFIQRSFWPTTYNEFHRVLKPGGNVIIVNLNTGYKPTHIYKEHVATWRKNKGLLSMFVNMVTLLPASLKMFYYNLAISKNGMGESGAGFVKSGEQMAALKAAHFVVTGMTRMVFANQALLDIGVKPA